jgi:hypothetical protein
MEISEERKFPFTSFDELLNMIVLLTSICEFVNNNACAWLSEMKICPFATWRDFYRS